MELKQNLFSLRGKIIVITGGYGHLGKAIVEALLAFDAEVVVLARNKVSFEKSFTNFDRLHFFEADIAQHTTVELALKETVKRFERIDVLINNAVYLQGQDPELMSNEDWDIGVDGTLNQVFRCIKAVIPYFKQAGSGKIINVSSMYGIVAPDFSIYEESPSFLNPPHYGAAKAGVLQLTRYYASYLAKYNIQVNSITPGPFPSEEVQKDEPFISRLANKTLANRVGKPKDLQGSFVLLASSASDFITGQNIIIDGGWTVR